MAVAINKPDSMVGLPAGSSMVGSLAGQMVPGIGLANGMGAMSGLTNGSTGGSGGVGGPPGKPTSLLVRLRRIDPSTDRWFEAKSRW